MRIVSALCLVMLLTGCIVSVDSDDSDRRIDGSGAVVVEARTLVSFRSVSFAAEGTLYITVGDHESLRIEAEDNLLPYLVTGVRDETLEIETEEGFDLRPRRPMNLYLTVRTLDALTVAGSGSVELSDFSADGFVLAVTGSGSARLVNIDTPALEVSVVGSGSVEATGSAAHFVLSLSSSGFFAGRELACSDAVVSVLGSGSADIWASDRLVVSILGSGSVHYRGDPIIVSSVLGSGLLLHDAG